DEARLEIDAGGQVQVAVRGPRIAVDATVLAAPVGIEPLHEADIGRIVARDGAAGVLPAQLGGRWRRLGSRVHGQLGAAPAVIERVARVALEPVRLPPREAPALERLHGYAVLAHIDI